MWEGRRARVGTWNSEGRWSERHAQLLRELDCDVWLLTEVHVDADLSGFTMCRTAGLMDTSKIGAAVATKKPAHALPDPHFATAMAEVEGTRFLSSILPWRSSGAEWPGRAAITQARTISTTWNGKRLSDHDAYVVEFFV